jgi:hypothetical protein
MRFVTSGAEPAVATEPVDIIATVTHPGMRFVTKIQPKIQNVRNTNVNRSPNNVSANPLRFESKSPNNVNTNPLPFENKSSNNVNQSPNNVSANPFPFESKSSHVNQSPNDVSANPGFADSSHRSQWGFGLRRRTLTLVILHC